MNKRTIARWMDDADPLVAEDLAQPRIWFSVLDDHPARWLADQWYMRYTMFGPSLYAGVAQW